eukprot:COSAG02_NODE_5195_length_4551_cov_1.826370_5_plen_102_part_00
MWPFTIGVLVVRISLSGLQWWDDADGVCAESQYDCGGFGDSCLWAADTECDVVGDFDGASIVSYCDAGTVRKTLDDTQSLAIDHPRPSLLWKDLAMDHHRS